MILAAQIEWLKARQMIARGEAPGNLAKNSQALKGWSNLLSGCASTELCVAPTGLGWFVGFVPGASPRAVAFRPCWAGEGMVGA